MRKRWIVLIALTISAAMILAGCGTKTQEGQSQAGTGSGASAGAAAAQAEKKDDKGSTASTGTAVVDAGAGENAPAGAEEGAAPAQEGSADNSQDVVSADDTYDAANQSGDGPDHAPLRVNWEGTYNSLSGETVTITQADEHTINFSFAVSGISGTADVEGNQAVYSGDDQMQVYFDHYDTSMEIYALNTEGQVEETTFSGTFSRQ